MPSRLLPLARSPSTAEFPVVGFLFRLAVVGVLMALAFTGAIPPERCLAFAVFTLSLRLSQPFSTLNFISLYWLMTFVVIAPVHVEYMWPTLCLHYVAIQTLITLGYYYGRTLAQPRPGARPRDALAIRRARLQLAWYIAITVGVLLALVQILTYGPSAWFSGQILALTMDRYSSGDPLEALARDGFWIVNWTLFALFVIQRESGLRLRGTLAGFGLLPLISMARQTFVYNMLFVLFTDRKRSRALNAAFVAFAALVAALLIGAARSDQLQQDSGPISLIQSEFSSSIVYASLLENPRAIPRQWGATIIPPILLAPVPRFVFPTKPQNGNGLYMETFEPDALAAGYSYAINCFSDALINFGMPGVLILAIVVGGAFGWVDKGLEKAVTSPLQFALIFNIYFLMRMAIAESVTFIILQLFIFVGLKWWLGVTAPSRAIGRDVKFGNLMLKRPEEIVLGDP